MPVIDGEPTVLVIRGSIENVPIRVLDDNNNLVDATSLTLTVYDQGENIIVQDDITNGYGTPPTLPSHIVHDGTGMYHFAFGDTTFDSPTSGTMNSTATAMEYTFVWKATVGSNPTVSTVQVAKVSSISTLRQLNKLRLIIDKAVKAIDTNPNDPVYVGYTDVMLVQFLEDGLSLINSFPPYPTWSTVDQFPSINLRILLDAAAFCGLVSQEIFAIDTDQNFCFVEGSPVSLADGTKKSIETLVIGDRVISHNGMIRDVYFANDDGNPSEVVEIDVWGHGKIQSTKSHKWPVYTWPRFCACSTECEAPVKVGKTFALGHYAKAKSLGTQETKSAHEHKIMFAKDLKKEDFLKMPRKFEEWKTDVTPEEARLLGYYTAEGYLKRTPSGKVTNFSFSFNKNETDTWVSEIEQILGGLNVETYRSPSKTTEGIALESKNDYGRNEQTIRLAQFFEKHAGEGSLTKKLSEEVMHWPLRLKIEFLKGLIRGDGHKTVSETKGEGKAGKSFGVKYSTSSPFLASQVELILTQLGYPVRKTHNKGKRVAYIHGVKTTAEPNTVLHVPPPWAQELGTLLWGPEYIHAYENARKGWKMPAPQVLVDDDYVYVPIRSVKVVKNTKKVYNISVAEDHTYLVNNIATCNSDQGNTYTIDHFTKLDSVVNAMWARLQQSVTVMKNQYLRNGGVRVEIGYNARFAALVETSPYGSLFRNVIANI